MTQITQVVCVLLCGLTTGVFSGLFGIGGGVILVPILVMLLKFPQQTASGTSLIALKLPVGALGVMEYYRAGKIRTEHIRWGLWIALGIFVGTYFGSKIAIGLPESVLRRLYSVPDNVFDFLLR